MPIYRLAIPVRTCIKKHARYTSYKKYLRQDFNKRCGYCDDRDVICGGVRGFHIDHFRPQNHFPHLVTEYSNLVYACPYCNGSKSDDWPSGSEGIGFLDGQGYIDPCDVNFDQHFERQDDGQITPRTDIGNYMFKQLKLGLRRHQLAWQYEQLENLLCQLNDELENYSGDSIIEKKLKDHHLMLTKEYFRSKSMFEETI